MRTLSFYTFSAQDETTLAEVDPKPVIHSIIKEHAKTNKNVRTLLLEYGNEEIAIDVLHEKDELLFCRIGHKKDLESTIKRNKTTLQPESVLSEDEIQSKDIESNTYFLMDFEYGIISYVSSQSAPRVNKLVYITQAYDTGVKLNLTQIVNPERVDSLLKSGSVLSSIEYTFPIPSVEILENIGLDSHQITALRESDVVMGKLILKAEPRKPLTRIQEVISGIVGSIKGTEQQEQMLLRGKEPDNRPQQYRFGDDYVTYQVDLPSAKTQNGMKIKLSLDERDFAAQERIIATYQTNRRALLMYAGKV